eukprot:gene33977-56674_t
MLRKLQDVSGSARMLAMFGGGALMSTSAALLGMNLGVVSAPPPLALPWVLGVLAMSAVWLLANFALQYGASRLSSSTTCIIMLSEVVFATVSSVLMGAGTLTLNTLLGGALILLASLLAVLSKAGELHNAQQPETALNHLLLNMPNALPLAVPYRDRKRYAWLFSLVIPATVLIGPALMLTTGNPWALWIPVVFFYSVVP